MNKLIPCIFILLFFQQINAQKHDYNWMIGDMYDVQILDFNVSPPDYYYWGNGTSALISFPYYAAFSDSSGNLIYYTNGSHFYNKNNLLLAGSDLNTTYAIGRGGVVALPHPGKPNHSLVFRTNIKNPTMSQIDVKLYLTEIDHQGDNGKGAIVQDGQELFDGRIYPVQACKHGNGRDWWVTAISTNKPEFYTFLVTPDGVTGPFIQNFQPGASLFYPAPGMIALSQDGTKLIRAHNSDSLHYYSFDRCSGLFSYIGAIATSGVSYSGGAFSPDSRMLYLTDRRNIYSIDMETWPHQPDSLALFGGFDTPDASDLFTELLITAPDDKIYVLPSCYGNFYHRINRPELPPFAADFQYKALDRQLSSCLLIHTYPNYRLGKLEGSACDSLALQGHFSEH